METDYQHMSSAERTWFTTPQGSHVQGRITDRETVASAREGVRERLTVVYKNHEFTIERPVSNQ